MRKGFIGLFMMALTILPLGACSSHSMEEQEKQIEVVEVGDLREKTDDRTVLPVFLDDKAEEMQGLYKAVAQHQELLEYIPCYCGCGSSVGHHDNYDCFIYENNADGSVVWDDHATRCLACLEIAAESIVMYNDGKSMKEIRTHIDERYKEGYAEPTPTPMPEM